MTCWTNRPKRHRAHTQTLPASSPWVGEARWGANGYGPECWFFRQPKSRNHSRSEPCLPKVPDRDPELARLWFENWDRVGRSNCDVAKDEWHPHRAIAKWFA